VTKKTTKNENSIRKIVPLWLDNAFACRVRLKSDKRSFLARVDDPAGQRFNFARADYFAGNN
jgi:uncharacterized protein YcbX